jgi:hypothetical protein
MRRYIVCFVERAEILDLAKNLRRTDAELLPGLLAFSSGDIGMPLLPHRSSIFLRAESIRQIEDP